MPWAERREPSITNSPFRAKPQRCANWRMRPASSGSLSGVNLLNSGAMKVG
ncbi:Uncharacterised protein [Bordetella pertussis]|nr:Uncharacterised protein [Bordetella pertussis]